MQMDEIKIEMQRLIKHMPPEWENPSNNFQPSGQRKNMFDFDPQQNTGVFDRLQYWMQDNTFKMEAFQQLQECINPRSGSLPTVQGIRIQRSTMQHIKEFFQDKNVATQVRGRVACLWVDSIVNLDMIKELLGLFPNVTAVRFEPIPRQTHPLELIHRVHPLVQMCVA